MGKPYSVATLADHWGCGTDTVYSLIHSGDLPAFRLGGRLLRIRPEAVEEFECQRNTASNDTGVSSPSSGTKTGDAADIRLERLIARQPKPQRGPSGNDAR